MSGVVNTTFRDQRSALEKLHDENLKRRVLRGLEKLKEEFGEEWVEHIDPERLDMGSETRCILGQIFGGYSEGKKILGIYRQRESGSMYGFDSGGGIGYDALNEAWLAVLTKDPYK